TVVVEALTSPLRVIFRMVAPLGFRKNSSLQPSPLYAESIAGSNSIHPFQRSPPLLKMVHRSVPVANLKLVCRGNRSGDIGFGLPSRDFEIEPLGKPRRDCRRQRAPGPVQVPGGDPLGRKAHNGAMPSQQIEPFLTPSAPSSPCHPPSDTPP